ncbi:oxidoreductase [Kitasatospora sp. NPDC049258]|uniref:oxidoreductase n=1 Tax=Kitasatospora sp. NPDC049258 TaxID=3155394 RepID=UPI00341D72DB
MLGYDELTVAERRVWDAFPTGAVVDLAASSPVSVTEGAGWGPERTVRAELLAGLLLGGRSPVPGAIAALRLTGARITGRLDLAGARLEHELALTACRFEEQVSLRGAALRSTSMHSCRLPGLDGWLLNLDGNLFFEDSVIDGRLTLTRAHITGELRLSGVRLTATELLNTPDPGPETDRSPDAACADGVWALWAGGMVLDGGCFARKGFRSRGGLRLVGAQFNGGLFMEGARIDNPGGDALGGDDLSASTMVLADGFSTDGAIRLPGAGVRSLLSLDGAVLAGTGAALAAPRLRAGELRFTPAGAPRGSVDLQEAQLAVLCDHRLSWPPGTRLDGLTYTSLQSTAPAPLARRLDWLAGLPEYAPQPYEQLAAWYRKSGEDDAARRVLLAKQRRRRRTLHPLGRAWGRVLDATVGYGYRPWQAGLWLIALTALGTAVFSTGTPAPAQAEPGAPFSAVIYTLDLLLPIGGFGQRTAWYWTGAQQWFGYGLIAAGWLLTTALLAGVSRSLNRQ